MLSTPLIWGRLDRSPNDLIKNNVFAVRAPCNFFILTQWKRCESVVDRYGHNKSALASPLIGKNNQIWGAITLRLGK